MSFCGGVFDKTSPAGPGKLQKIRLTCYELSQVDLLYAHYSWDSIMETTQNKNQTNQNTETKTNANTKSESINRIRLTKAMQRTYSKEQLKRRADEYHIRTGKSMFRTIQIWISKLETLENCYEAIQLIHDSRDLQFILQVNQNYDMFYGIFYRDNIKTHRIKLNTILLGLNRRYEVIERSKRRGEVLIGTKYLTDILSCLNHIMQQQFEPADAQVDAEEEQATVSGQATSVGDKQSNTIVTRDTIQTKNLSATKLPRKLITQMCNSEETATFPIWQHRFISFKTLTFSTTNKTGDVVAKYTFPRDLYAEATTPLVRPYTQFGLNRTNITVKVKVNSNKFNCGKYIISYMYDPLSAVSTFKNDGDWTSPQAATQRGHALLDLNESNEAELTIPYVSKCPYTTSLPSAEKYFAGAATIGVALQCLAPLRTGSATSTTVPVNIYISTPETQFIGMRYEVAPSADAQGGAYSTFKDVSKDVIGAISAVPLLGGVVKVAGNLVGKSVLAIERTVMKPETVANIEKDLKYVGIINNRDKPRNPNGPNNLLPDATGPLAVGTNVTESLRYMGLDPTATCVHLPDHQIGEPIRNIKDLIRVWQYQDTFTWAQSDLPGKQLFTIIPAPGYMNDFTKTAVGQRNALQCFSQYFTYYAGTIEFRFDFVSTQFHTGLVKIAFVPYRDDFTDDQANSGYFKVFDLRSVTFTVPYISPTVVRNCQGTPFDDVGYSKPTIGSLKMFVQNPLTPILSVSTTIDVLVYVRAGPDFAFSYPRPTSETLPDVPNIAKLAFGFKANTTEAADAQMESGEDADVDSTPDFGGLLPGATLLQTFEEHMDIKTICRRWVYKESYTADSHGVIIFPVTLPYVKRNDQQRDYSLTAYIMRNVRYYRGSMNLMLEFHGSPTFPRVMHVPQDAMLGTTDEWPAITNSHTLGKMFSGYASEIVVTNINPILKLNIPMHGPFDYLDSQLDSLASPGYAQGWLDRVATNLGHIIITECTGGSINLYWSMGDDAEIYCWNPSSYLYVGDKPAPVETALKTIDTQKEKKPADAQMESEDDDDTEIDDPIMSEYTGPTTETIPPARKFFSLSGFGRRACDRVYDAFVSTAQPIVRVKQTVSELPTISDSLKRTISKVDDAMDYLKEIATNMVNGIKKSCSWLTSCGTIFSCILHFLQAIINPTWKAFSIAIVGVITSLGCFTADFGNKLLDFFMKSRAGRSAEEQPTAEQADAQCRHSECNICTDECRTNCRTCQNDGRIFDDNTIGTLVGLVFASVSAMLGYSGEKPETKMFTKLLNISKNFWTTIRGATSFLTTMVTLIRRIYNYCAKRIGRVAATQALTASANTQALESFIKEATYMIDERNIQQINSNPSFKYRFWYTVSAAYQHLARITASAMPNTSALARLCYKVIEQGNKLAIQSMACPVRYEPFVLSIEGDSKLGKSFMLQDMLPQLLQSDAYNLTTYDAPVYVRTPGVEFWNGYRNQPCILYDDFLAVNIPEIAVSQVVELYNLKSSALFNVNMAHLETKEMVGNPFVVALATNDAFTVVNGTICPPAFLRRKEHLWKVSMVEKYRGFNIHDIPDAVKEKFEHLEFQRYMDPADHTSLTGPIIGYAKWFKLIVEECKKYHEREKKNVKRRMDRLTALLPETASAMMTEVDPFNIFYGAYHKAADEVPTQGGFLPSELVDEQLRMTTRIVRLEEEARRGSVQPAILTLTNEEHVALIERNDLANQQQLMLALETDEPDAQGPMSWLCPPELRTWYNRMKRNILPQPPTLDQMEQGECSVCREETHLPFTCAGRHHLCEQCNRGMRLASYDEDGPEYRCGVCRQEIIDVRLTPEYWTHAHGTIYWLYVAHNKMTRMGRKLMSGLKTVMCSRAFKISISVMLTVAYISFCTYIVAEGEFKRAETLNLFHNAWNDRDDFYLITVMKRWGPFFYTTDEYVDHNTYYANAQSEDDDLIPISDEEYEREQAGTSHGYELEKEDLTVDKPEWSWISGKASRDLQQYIKEIPEHLTAETRCRHINLLRVPVKEISYERDDNNIGWWHMERSGKVADNPCQYEDCPFKDSEERHRFLNNWAIGNPLTIDMIRRAYDPNRGILSWQLPTEYMTPQLQAGLNRIHEDLQQVIDNIRQRTWTERLGGAWQSIKRCLKVLGMILVGLGSLVGAIALVKCMVTSGTIADTTPVAQVVSSGSMVTRHIQRKMFRPRITTNLPEAQIRQDIEERAVKVIERNTVFLRLTREGYNEVKLLRGIGLFGRVAVFPGHFGKLILSSYEKNPTGVTLEIEQFMHRDCKSTVEVSKDMFVFSENDFCYMKTPQDFPLFKDITNQIPTAEQHTHIGGAYLHVECVDKRQMINTIPGVIQGNIDRQAIRGTTNWSAYEIFDVYLTTYGKDGSCGSVLVSDCNTPLFAMHVAGHNNNPLNNTGYAIPLIREDVEALKQGQAVLSYWRPNLKKAVDAQMSLPGCINPIGAVRKQDVAFMPKVTKIIPSNLQGVLTDMDGTILEAKTQPGILDSADERYKFDKSPLYYGCLKHTKPPKRFEETLLDQCVEEVKCDFRASMVPMRDITTPLTYEQAISGFNHLEYYDSMDLSTSAGWPWNTQAKKVKSEYIKIVRDKHSTVTEVKIDPEVVKVLDRNSKLRQEGTRPFTVFLDWLKDERRKEKKLALADGTRIFSLSPMDLTIQMRQRFLDFAASFMFNRELLQHAVGISTDGPEWSRLANGLLANSDKIVTGDYSDFGPRLASQLVRAAFDIIIDWYKYNGQTDPAILQEMIVMTEEVSNAYHIMHDFIYETQCGIPSGNILTVIINSIVNMLYIRYVWYKIFPTSTHQEFKGKVFLKTYGDDMIMSVKEDVLEKFNCRTISEILAQYDIVFTDAEKTGTKEYDTIYNSTFLKSGFARHPTLTDQWLAPLDELSIKECALWIWKSYDNEKATIANAEQSLRLAYGRGQAYFKQWKTQLNTALARLRYSNIPITWHQVDRLFFSEEVMLGQYEVCSRINEVLGLTEKERKPQAKEGNSERVLRLLLDEPPQEAATMTKGQE
ncbi:polyprotein [Diabrotica virgifera virgifera virus 1]|nr:polyprotein [Diabrotica virgifera virgifera virus 1]